MKTTIPASSIRNQSQYYHTPPLTPPLGPQEYHCRIPLFHFLAKTTEKNTFFNYLFSRYFFGSLFHLVPPILTPNNPKIHKQSTKNGARNPIFLIRYVLFVF